MLVLDLRLAVTPNPPPRGAVKVQCKFPGHDDPNASMAVYRDNVHCFGCGKHLNDADAALALLLGTSQPQALSLLPTFEAGEYIAKADSAPRGPLPPSTALMYHRFLYGYRSDRLEWLYARGLTDETIAKAQIGHDGLRFVIPVWDSDGQLCTLRFRRDDAYWDGEEKWPKYVGLPGRNGFHLYGANWLPTDSEEVVICEGELDALSAVQAGFPAISATNGASRSSHCVGPVRELLPRLAKVYACVDQDGPGHEAAREIAVEAAGLGLAVERWAWYDAKDITEHLSLHGGKLFIYRETWDGRQFRPS